MKIFKNLIKQILSSIGYFVINKNTLAGILTESTAESFFDFILGRYLQSKGFKKQIHFLQIGAHDGQNMDPLEKYTDSFKWCGIMVEPIKSNFLQLSKRYEKNQRIKIINCAVAWESGYKIMYKISEGCETAPPWASMIASFSREHLLKFQSIFPDIEEHIVNEKVECCTIDQIIGDNGANHSVDLVVIDTEGFDYQVILMLFKSSIEPTIIHCEIEYMTSQEKNELIKMLENNCYSFAIEGRDLTAFKET